MAIPGHVHLISHHQCVALIEVIMLHELDRKNLHINELIFLQNQKIPILGVFLGIIPKLRFFPKNPTLSVLTLKAP